MWKERLHKFLHYYYGDRLTNVLIFGGIMLMLDTRLWYLREGYFYTYFFTLGMVMMISGFAYKELIFDKKKDERERIEKEKIEKEEQENKERGE